MKKRTTGWDVPDLGILHRPAVPMATNFLTQSFPTSKSLTMSTRNSKGILERDEGARKV